MLKELSMKRGLPLSTYIKFVLTDELRKDPLWNKLEDKSQQAKIVEEFTNKLKGSKRKKTTSTKTKRIISELNKR